MIISDPPRASTASLRSKPWVSEIRPILFTLFTIGRSYRGTKGIAPYPSFHPLHLTIQGNDAIFLLAVERSAFHGAQTERPGPGHAGHADPENIATGSDAWLRDSDAY